MTKTEFFHNVLRVCNNFVKYHHKAYYYKFRRRPYNLSSDSTYRQSKRVAQESMYQPTYKMCAGWYDFLNNMGISFDFLDRQIILHFDKLVIKQNNHTIRDVYVAFRPVINKMASKQDMSLTILRTTFTVKEFAMGYCHPHVNYQEDLSVSTVCMGSTPFIPGDSVDYNFYQFVIYIKEFLEHEHNNPYVATRSLKEDDFDYNALYFDTIKALIDWSKIQYEIVNVGKYKIVQPKVDDSEIEYYKKLYGDEIVVITTEDGTLNKAKADLILQYPQFIYPFKFQGKQIIRKIIYDDSEEKINPNWRRSFQSVCAGPLTRYFLETINNNLERRTDASRVLVQEDS